MKLLIFTAILSNFNIAQAYLVKGVRTTVLIVGQNKSEIEDVSFEGCDKDSCVKPEYKSKCTEVHPSKYSCYLKDQFPIFARFTIKFKENRSLSSKFFSTHRESSLDNFKLNISNNDVSATPMKDIL